MKIVENKLYVLEEDDRLNLIEGNRVSIDRTHVLGIAKAMMEGATMPPILVDRKTRYIVDGQNRYGGWLHNLRNGNYTTLEVVFNDYENPLAAAMIYNGTSKKWELPDFIEAGIHLGCDGCAVLSHFCETHAWVEKRYTSALVLLKGSENTKSLKNQKLVITDGELKTAETLYNELSAIADKFKKEKIFSSYSIKAWRKIRTQILNVHKTIQDYIDQLDGRRFKLPTSSRQRDWEDTYIKAV